MKNKQVTTRKKESERPMTLESLAYSVNAVSVNIDHLTMTVAKGFSNMYSEINTRFNEVNRHFDHVDKRFDQIDDRIDGIEERLIRIEHDHGARLEILEQK